MLPACRTDGEGFSIPTFDVVPSDVEGFMEALWEFQSTFHDCFARSEPRAHFFDYMVGQFSKLERKSIEPMALQVEGGTIRGMQRFISDVTWDEEQMVQRTVDTFGGLDILVVNAGVNGERQPVEDSHPEVWRTTLEVNWVWLFLNDDTFYVRQGVTTNQCFSIGLSWGRLVVKNTVGHFPGGPRGCITPHASHRNRSTRPVWSLKT
jgi:hypothetical protein